jgi:ribonucleoside-diphosphate reductase alpha chain
VFRRLALDYLDPEIRSSMGIYTAGERARQLETGSYAVPVASEADGEVSDELEGFAQSAPLAKKAGKPVETWVEAADIKSGSGAASAKAVEGVGSTAELVERFAGKSADAPICMICGTKMRPAGSCYVCEGCGNTSGCS